MAIFPIEREPDEAVILELNGRVDAATGLEYIPRGVNAHSSPSYEVRYNRRLLRQNGILAALRQGTVVEEGPLTIGVYPIRYTLGSARKSFDGAGGLTVPDDATRKVYLDSNNVLQVAAAFSGGVSTYLPLATIVAAAGELTITDERVLTLFAVP
jgi:high-affinity nickel permease